MMKLSNHVIERFSHRCEEIQTMMVNMIMNLLENASGEVYHDSRHGWRYAIPVEQGVFICNQKKTHVITFVSKESISQKDLRHIYRRRYR
jgi:hypothetical protein